MRVVENADPYAHIEICLRQMKSRCDEILLCNMMGGLCPHLFIKKELILKAFLSFSFHRALCALLRLYRALIIVLFALAKSDFELCSAIFEIES